MSASTSAPTEPVRKSVRVERSIEDTFHLFTDRIADWWPVDHFSRTAEGELGTSGLARIVFEPREGGRVYEVASDGTEGSWATVLAFEPPTRLVLAWKPHDRPVPPTEVEVRFSPDGAGTRVDLEHRGWDVLGEDAEEGRRNYASGWTLVLDRFVAAGR